MFVVLEGMCMEAMAFIEEIQIQRLMLCLMIVVPVACDTAAYYVGTIVRGAKLCP